MHDLDAGSGELPEEMLHPCCQKELRAGRVRSRIMKQLTAADVTRHAMERRKSAVGVLPHGWLHTCNCCPPGGDYPALQRLRASLNSPSQPVLADSTDESGRDNDSDDELLRELEAEDSMYIEMRKAEEIRRAAELVEIKRLGVGFHTEFSYTQIQSLIALGSHVVCHLYDPYDEICASFDLLLEQLARVYAGTRFVRISYAARVPLMRQMKLLSMHGEARAAALAIRGGCCVDVCWDLKGSFGSRGELYADVVEQWLRHAGVLSRDMPRPNTLREALWGIGSQVESSLLAKGEDEDQEYFDCGLEECCKTFAHSHVGVGALPKAFSSATVDARER